MLNASNNAGFSGLSRRVHPRLAAVPRPYSERLMLICVGPHVDDLAIHFEAHVARAGVR